jgi:hypothetical protein
LESAFAGVTNAFELVTNRQNRKRKDYFRAEITLIKGQTDEFNPTTF